MTLARCAERHAKRLQGCMCIQILFDGGFPSIVSSLKLSYFMVILTKAVINHFDHESLFVLKQKVLESTFPTVLEGL